MAPVCRPPNAGQPIYWRAFFVSKA